MAKLLKLRRGTTSQHSSFTGAEGEVTVDTTKDTLVVHDGSTAGGIPLAKESAAYTHPNHSGEVTSSADGAQTIASNVVDEDNLKVSNSPTNGHFLQAQSGNTGGLTWAAVSSTPEGTAVLSTGESGGTKFLREDGDNSCSWQTIPVPTTITVADESSDTSCKVLFTTTATGDLAPKTGTNLTFNSNTGILTATGFVGDITGDVTGRASTSTNITVADESSDTSCNVLFTTAAVGDLPAKSGTNLTFNSSTGALESTILKDSIGSVRSLGATSSNTTLAVSDVGKVVALTSGTVTVPNNTFSQGDIVSIYNYGSSNITITGNTSSWYWAADGTSANRTLAPKGMATIYFLNNAWASISGSGLT